MDSEKTKIQLRDFVWREYKFEKDDIFKKYQLPVDKRVQKGFCVSDLRFQYEQKDNSLVYSFDSSTNFCFSQGEYVVLNHTKTQGDKIAEGTRMWIAAIDSKNKLVTLDVADRFTLEKFAKDNLLSLTLDRACSDRNARRLFDAIDYTFDEPCDLRNLIVGEEIPLPVRTQYGYSAAHTAATITLTRQQKTAYERAISSQLTLIQGPPGSGKTRLLVQIILQALRQMKTILVTAYTHSAINNLLGALACARNTEDFNIYKVGSSVKRTKLPDGVEFIECKARSLKTILEEPTVVGATMFKAHEIQSFGLTKFDLIIIDEAAQMPLVNALPALLCGEKFVLAGDHKQLPPIIRAEHKTTGAAVSIFEHLHDLYPDLNIELDLTFRMNHELTEFPSREFYFGKLKAATSSATRKFAFAATKKPLDHIIERNEAVTYVEVPHLSSTSINMKEADAAAQLAHTLIVHHGLAPSELAIIAPFNKHKNDITHRLKKLFEETPPWAAKSTVDSIAISTVEKMQGQEREVVILTLCSSKVSYLKECQDFLYKPNRLNVAITRCKTRLFVIASPNFFPCINGNSIEPEHARVFDEYYYYLQKRRVPFERAAIIPEIPLAQADSRKNNLPTVA